MQLRVELPEMGVEADAELYADAAPTVCEAIFASLAQPLETETTHACFDGHEVYCFLPPFADPPPLENRTMRPEVGELMFFYAAPGAFSFMGETRLSGGQRAIHELAFIYGKVDLRHYWEEGLHGSLVGRLTRGLDEFAEACGRTLNQGRTALRITRVE
jgi:hypothetical protein